MPAIGTRMQCSHTGRVGEFLALTVGAGYTCRDPQTGEYFIIRKSVRGVRKLAAKPRKRKWRPAPNGGPVNPELKKLARKAGLIQ